MHVTRCIGVLLVVSQVGAHGLYTPQGGHIFSGALPSATFRSGQAVVEGVFSSAPLPGTWLSLSSRIGLSVPASQLFVLVGFHRNIC